MHVRTVVLVRGRVTLGHMASGSATRTAIPDEEMPELLSLLKGSDSVELKLTVPESQQRSAVASLGLDPLDAQIRQVFFFDTPDLALNRSGVVVRARRVQNKGDDSVVKLRPVVPDELPRKLRRSPSFGVEVDAMPGGFVCSALDEGITARRVGTGVRRGQATAPQAVLEGAAGVLRRLRPRRPRARGPRTARPDLRAEAQVLTQEARAPHGRGDVALPRLDARPRALHEVHAEGRLRGRRRDARPARGEGREPLRRAADQDAQGPGLLLRRTEVCAA